MAALLLGFRGRDGEEHSMRNGAARLMLHIHRNGAGACGTYPSDVARLKATQVRTHARVHDHPLRCILSAP